MKGTAAIPSMHACVYLQCARSNVHVQDRLVAALVRLAGAAQFSKDSSESTRYDDRLSAPPRCPECVPGAIIDTGCPHHRLP